MKLGIRFPTDQLLADGLGAVRHYIGALEEMGYSYLSVGEHVLGAERESRPEWKPYFGKPPLYDHKNSFHEPFVLFGLLAGMSSTIEFATGVLVAPQRQAALMAKQAAEVDVLSGGRLRLVIGTGWNDVEMEALGVDFKTRGPLMDEQIDLMRMLWTQELVTYEGRFHRVIASGINPLPVQQPIPIWFGGITEPVLRRTGRTGDGWFPSYPFFNRDEILGHIERIHQHAREAGRDPADIEIAGMVFFHDVRYDLPAGSELPPQTFDDCLQYAKWWEGIGATHFSVSTPWAGTAIDEQLAALQAFKAALEA